MKQFCILILFLCISFNTFAQKASKDSIIYLKEVAGEKVKEKSFKVKTKGEELASTFENGLKSRVCLLEEVPEGDLQSVKLYFNSGLINLAKKSLKVEYKDTELKLVMYEAGEDGMPGAGLFKKDIRFVVKASHKGALELDLSSLKIKTQSKFLIGIELVEDTTDYTPVVLKIVANNGVTYIKDNKTRNWNKDTTFPNQIKLELRIVQ